MKSSALDPAVMRRAAATFEFTRPNAEQRFIVLRNAFPDSVCSETDCAVTAECSSAEPLAWKSMLAIVVPVHIVCKFEPV